MTRRCGTRLVATGLTVALAALPWAASAQTGSAAAGPGTSSPQAATTQDPQPGPDVLRGIATDAGLERIREGLEKMPNAVFTDGKLRFYAFVAVKQPTIDRFLENYDLVNGPTRGGNPMSHQEFLNMVTPKELYGSGGIKGYEMLQFALVNWLGQKVISKGLEAIKNARDEREVKEIRDRIDRELAALRGGG
ncbi:MAG: hypothetical protein R2752_05005 [Vicinamibacterales bacterium]